MHSQLKTQFASRMLAMVLMAPGWVSAEIWPVKEFEVFVGEPSGATTTIAGQFIDMDTELTPSVPLPDNVRLEMERFLAEVATILERDGWKAPYLEPVVKNAAGRPAFRVYYFDSILPAPAGRLGDACGKVTPYFFINPKKFLKNAQIPHKSYQDLAHEIFHGVQSNYPLFKQHCIDGPGNWITEGTAQALGADVAAKSSWHIDFPNALAGQWPVHRWGLRAYDYSPYTPSPKAITYGASSFWRYLGELSATGGAAGTRAVTPDYTYLQKFFDSSMPLPITQMSSMRWLDEQVSDKTKMIGTSLHRLYPNFVTTFAAYGGTRINPAGFDPDPTINAAANRRRWLNNVFLTYRCPQVELGEGQDSQFVALDIRAFTAQCVQLKWNRSYARDLQVRVFNPDKSQLRHITLGTKEGAVVMQPTLVKANDEWSTTWLVSIEPGAQPIEFIFTNLASNVSDTDDAGGLVEFSIPFWDSNLWQGPIQSQPGATQATQEQAPAVLSRQSQDARVKKETSAGLKTLNPGLIGGSTLIRKPKEGPCDEAFLTIPCGPRTTISLELLPGGMYGSGWSSSGRGGVFSQFAGMLSGLAQLDPAEFDASMHAAVEEQENMDGAKVSITFPLIDYGFTGSFSNADLRVSARGGETYRAIGPGDIEPGPGRSYPLSGKVTIESYSPWEVKGTYSGSLVNIDRLNLVGDDPSLPAEQFVSGRFQIVAPWQQDERTIIELAEDPAESVLADVEQMMGGIDLETRERVRAAVQGNQPVGGTSGGGYIEPACDCSCNLAENTQPECLPVCSATYAACKGKTLESERVKHEAQSASNAFLRTLPDACRMLDEATALSLLDAPRVKPSGPRNWQPDVTSQCGLRDAHSNSGQVSLQMLFTPRVLVDSATMERDKLRAIAGGLNQLAGGKHFDVEGVGNIGFGFVQDGTSTLKIYSGIYGTAPHSDEQVSELVLTYAIKDPDQEDHVAFKKLYDLAREHLNQLQHMSETSHDGSQWGQ